MATYKHIGYYNDKADIKELFGSPKEIILSYKELGYGHFYTTEDDGGYDGKDFKDCLGKDGDDIIITKSLPRYKKDINENSFIDIYEREYGEDDKVLPMTTKEKFEEVKDIIPIARMGKHGKDGQFLYGDVLDWCRDYFNEPKDNDLALMLIGYWFIHNEPNGTIKY